MTRMRIEIVVDELVLRGVPREQAPLVAAALERRLELLAEAGPALGARAEAFRRAEPVDVPAAAPAALGEAVAGAVWGALGR